MSGEPVQYTGSEEATGKVTISAQGTARGTQARRRRKRSHNGGADRNWRNFRQSKVQSNEKRKSWRGGARKKTLAGTAQSNRKGRSGSKMGEVAMSGPSVPVGQSPVPPEIMKQINQAAAQAALRGNTLPRAYANGFGIAITSTDLSIIFNVGGSAFSVIDLAYGTAKDLARSLANAIESYEKAVGQTVKTPSELQEAMTKVMTEANARQI
jgi:hypothetical protein